MDECHFQQHGFRLAAYIKDPIVRHEPTRNKIGIIGAVRASDGTLVAREEEKFNAQTTEIFFNLLLTHRGCKKDCVNGHAGG